jgi:hypothetical protein
MDSYPSQVKTSVLNIYFTTRIVYISWVGIRAASLAVYLVFTIERKVRMSDSLQGFPRVEYGQHAYQPLSIRDKVNRRAGPVIGAGGRHWINQKFPVGEVGSKRPTSSGSCSWTIGTL